jgi:hypothetical protein
MEEMPMTSPDPVGIISMVNMVSTISAPVRPSATCVMYGVTSPVGKEHQNMLRELEFEFEFLV